MIIMMMMMTMMMTMTTLSNSKSTMMISSMMLLGSVASFSSSSNIGRASSAFLLVPSPPSIRTIIRSSSTTTSSSSSSRSSSRTMSMSQSVMTNNLPPPRRALQSMTSHFNADIARIVSRTTSSPFQNQYHQHQYQQQASSSSSSSSPYTNNNNNHHAAEHAERMLLQMLNLYESTNGRTARPDIEGLRLVLWGYANLGRHRWTATITTATDDDDDIDGEMREICGADRMEELLKRWHKFQLAEESRWNPPPQEDTDINTNTNNVYANATVDAVVVLEPNVEVLNLILKAYARCAQQHVPTTTTDIILDEQLGSTNRRLDATTGDDTYNNTTRDILPPWLLQHLDSDSSRSSSTTYAERAEQTLQYMIHSTDTEDDTILQPNARSYAYVIEAWARQQPSITKYRTRYTPPTTNTATTSDKEGNRMEDNDRYVRRACKWIPRLERLYRLQTTAMNTSSVSTNNNHQQLQQYFETTKQIRRLLLYAHSDILDAWGRCDALESGWRAEEALGRIEGLSREDSLANEEEIRVVSQQQSMVEGGQYDQEIEDSEDKGGSGDVFSSTKQRGQLYESQQQQYSSSSPIETLTPSYQSYTSAILALSRSSNTDTTRQQQKQQGNNDQVKPSPPPHERAHQIFNNMLTYYYSSSNNNNILNNNSNNDQINPLAFNALLTAYARASRTTPGAADIAESILHQMEELSSSSQYDSYSDIDIDNTDGVDRSVFPHPTVVSYNTVIKAWVESGQGASVVKAEDVLRRMEERNTGGSSSSGVGCAVQPDAITYGSLIMGWIDNSGLGGVESAQNAERVLRELVDRFVEEEGSSNSRRMELMPDRRLFTSVIDAWAKCGDRGAGAGGRGGERALGMLELMEDLSSSSALLSSATCSSTSGDVGVESLQPDMIIYSTVIDAIARSGMVDSSCLALHMLDKVECAYLNTLDADVGKGMEGDESMKPSAKTYSCVLLALANDRKAGNDQKAWDMLDRMKVVGVQPNAFTYNYIINCASYFVPSDDDVEIRQRKKMETFKIALASFQSLRRCITTTTTLDAGPDSFTYSFFLKACLNLLPPDDTRRNVVRQTVKECCERGVMSDQILRRLVRRLSEVEVIDLLSYCGSDSIEVNLKMVKVADLAPDWSRNVWKKKNRGVSR